jgi:hypothetical protein
MAFRELAITAQDTFTDAMEVNEGARVAISVDIGTSTTVTLQRRLDGSNWRDVTDGSFSSDTEKTYVADSDCDLRIGVKSGDYGSGTTTVRLGGKNL